MDIDDVKAGLNRSSGHVSRRGTKFVCDVCYAVCDGENVRHYPSCRVGRSIDEAVGKWQLQNMQLLSSPPADMMERIMSVLTEADVTGIDECLDAIDNADTPAERTEPVNRLWKMCGCIDEDEGYLLIAQGTRTPQHRHDLRVAALARRAAMVSADGASGASDNRKMLEGCVEMLEKLKGIPVTTELN